MKNLLFVFLLTLSLSSCYSSTEKTVVFERCFDSDVENFDQIKLSEYVDKKFKEYEDKGLECNYTAGGKESIGCAGDLYYSFSCIPTKIL